MTASDATAFWVTAPGHGEVRHESIGTPGADQVLVRTVWSGISRGTESLVFRGEVPASEFQRMRAPFQSGDFPGPVKYGYSSVGVVEAGPAAMIGRHVFCLFPHQTRYVAPATAVHPIPAAVPPARAVLAANLETAINGLWDAGPRIGDRIAVVGGGVVGLLITWLAAKIPGCRVELVDVEPSREALAASFKAQFAAPADATGDADLVFHTSGTPAGLQTALASAGFEARVIEMSWYGSRPVTVPLGQSFHSRRLQLHSSQVGAVAASQRARWDPPRRMALALALLDDARLDALICGDTTLAQLPATMARLAAGIGNDLCHRVRYP